MTIKIRNIGLDLAVIGSAISIIGVLFNNLFLMHHTAMQVWVIGNLIFVVYFYGRWRCWWDGGVSNVVMCIMYVVMLVSGLWGLMQ